MQAKLTLLLTDEQIAQSLKKMFFPDGTPIQFMEEIKTISPGQTLVYLMDQTKRDEILTPLKRNHVITKKGAQISIIIPSEKGLPETHHTKVGTTDLAAWHKSGIKTVGDILDLTAKKIERLPFGPNLKDNLKKAKLYYNYMRLIYQIND